MNSAELKTDLIKGICSIEDDDIYIFTPDQRKRIEIALEQYKNGECISDEEANKEIQAWL